ncbi:N utilization substance protein B [Massilia sp. UYP32]|jgi:N utilization substance protein B|uniref:Transcription antitermination protein NusB n=2 Tax=Massilia timonae TaxID=47229 RepID=K9D4Y5_9BURK|nr:MULTISPECIES: transcription antitermination factor NusB [Massilia]EKU79689.1 transcription antitermination factor NusB [Massilia timonae CCUG 45783]OIJ42989.1 transcription antitermination factor NusB [Massilia timonae]QYG01989.1 transcription antitermination factor NusB [Massilia sp. NP310]
MTDKSTHANPSKNRTPRHRAREFALQGLYQWLLNNESARVVSTNIRGAHGFDKADSEFFSALLNGAISTSVELRESIAPLIDRAITELSPIEHAVLLLGAYELKNHPEIPYRVVINEAVELTKSFGGIDGHKYVNGVLDKLASRMRPDEVAANERR